MENQKNIGDQNIQQIGQNPVSRPIQVPQKPKFNLWLISSILLIVILVTSLILFALSKNNKIKFTQDQQPIASGQTDQNVTQENWITYKGDGLSFRHSPDWLIESPSKNVFSNEKIWKISRKDSENMKDIIFISRVRKYDPMPGSIDSLRSYLGEGRIVEEGKSRYAKATLVNNQKAIRYTNPGSKTEWNNDTLVIDIPEEHELLLIDFHDGWTTKDTWNPDAFNESVEKYFNPFLHSLEITETTWPQPGTYLSIISGNNSKNTDWSKFTESGYIFFHPNYWNVGYKDIGGEPYLNLVKVGGEKGEAELDFLDFPEVFIGNGEIFSTSGALCANAGLGECEEVGQIEIKVKERTYAAPIIKKKLIKDGRFTESFYYVFQVSLNRIPITPNIVTAVFKNQSEGQEIVDILSTITY